MKRIICFHLFNDYSGSPKALKVVLQVLLEQGYEIDLITSNGGILDTLEEGRGKLRRIIYRYPKFTSSPLEAIIRYPLWQIYTFFIALRYMFKRNVVFYINTILPIGPAIAGKLMGKRVIYHYHENAFVKSAFYRTLCKAMLILASDIMCVSEYQRSFLKREKRVYIVPNVLPKEFLSRLKPNSEVAFERKNILMLASLKLYKGVLEFFDLANRLSQYQFTLVLNEEGDNINNFIQKQGLFVGSNLKIYDRQNDVVPFYNQGSLVLNLSNKKKIIETFGLTALEAMAAGLPVIVPTEGGIGEMVENGKNGYKIDVENLTEISSAIERMLSNKDFYCMLAKNALDYSKQFNVDNLKSQINDIIS